MTAAVERIRPTTMPEAGPAGFVQALARDKIALAAAAYLVVLAGAAVFGPLLVDLGILQPPTELSLELRNSPPGVAPDGSLRLLGTDPLGRDVLSRLIFASRVSLTVGAATVVVSTVVGLVLGMLAGYFRRWVDDVFMRLVDIQMGFPQLLLALLVLYVLGPGFTNLILVLALTRWMIMARVTRAMTLSFREQPLIEAARAIGATDLRIMRTHVFPNILSPVLVLATLEFAAAMLSEASLSFLGLGIQPPDASWGLMLAQGKDYLGTAWWIAGFAGLAIMLSALSVHLLATWARETSDPTQRWRLQGAGRR